MEKQIYGNITNTARTQFQFDKIYPSRLIMDQDCKDDGIYAGRYVLVEYGEECTRGAVELIKKGNVYYYADFPTVIANPIQIEGVSQRTIALGKICYIEENKNYIFYKATENGFVRISQEIPVEKTDKYNYNWNLDYYEYKRGFDSTVWQKVYIDGVQKYIMIAELNTVVPNFVITEDAPVETPAAPHIDAAADNMNINIHMPAQWGFRVGPARDPNLSDEKIEHERIVYTAEGQEKKEIIKDIAADIFYNKDGLIPYEYLPITISETDSVYIPNIYYYKLDYGVYKKYMDEEWTFDGVEFYKSIEENKPPYYISLDKLEPIKLKQSDEYKYEPGKFYILSTQTFQIAVNGFDATEQYFERILDENNEVFFNPINLSFNDYIDGEYYTQTISYTQEPKSSVFSDTKEYFLDENGTPAKVVDKPIYEPDKYYAWVDNYYVLDDSTEQVKDRVYYEKLQSGECQEIKFMNRKYLPYTYFYKDKNGEYVLDRNDQATEKREYFRRAIPVIREGEDRISILPTGVSGKIYNHGSEDAIKDIQEIGIVLPSIGKTIAEVWNLMYSEKRNDMIYSSPVYNPMMYDKDGNSLYESNFNSFVGAINALNDFIGHNIIELSNKNSISINGTKVSIDNVVSEKINDKNVDRFVYKIGDEYYRAIPNENSVILISMSSGDYPIDTIYETILEIQKLLGLNEDKTVASSNSIKGALLRLNQAIDELNNGFEFVTVGEGLGHTTELGWRDIDGNPLESDYNSTTFVSAIDYLEEFQKYYNNKMLIPYTIEQAQDVNASNFNEKTYWISIILDEKTKYIKATSFSESDNYYIFKKSFKFTAPPSKAELEDKFIIDLPVFYVRDENGERIYKTELNIFEEVIDLYRYTVYHKDPISSGDLDTKYEIFIDDGHSAIKGFGVNKKGHVYGSLETVYLPQAIIVENNNALNELNVPIGTFVYIKN